MNSLRSFWHATSAFGNQITDVRVEPLAIAVAFTLANLILRASAWRVILQAGYPEGRVRWRSIVAAYLAGVGVNSIVPARGGDVMKVFLAHRAMPNAAYTTITSSLLAETLLDVFIGPVLLITAYLTGRIPHLPALGHLAAFEWSFFAAHARWFMLVMAVALILLGIFFTYVERHVVAFWSRVRLGLAILTTPRRYFRTVVPLQLGGWCCRIAAMYWFLIAFRVPAGIVDAALALSAQSAATLLPLTPGGLGTQQALLGYMFRNAAATSRVLAFSVGMQFMITLANAVAGGIAIWLTLRRLPWRARPAGADGVAPS
ncbi:MAG TPA: lysylphosphatidylglycerol synthase transmembrane domain-containing protein [Gaiellales bacterium]